MAKQKHGISWSTRSVLWLTLALQCGAIYARAEGESTGGSSSPVEEVLPSPTLGDDSLPVPSTKEEDSKYQVNKENLEDDIYLPAPTMQDNVTVAPQQMYSSGGVITTDFDSGATSAASRPFFSLGAGRAFRSYSSPLVLEQKQGWDWFADFRIFSLSDMAYLHLYGNYSYIHIGNVSQNDITQFQNLKETILTYGPMVEVAVGRRFSLLGGILHRSSSMLADVRRSDMTEAQKINILSLIAEPDAWRFGIGAQYDFNIVPHGSIGIRGYVESGMYSLNMVFSIEPAPRQKLSFDQGVID